QPAQSISEYAFTTSLDYNPMNSSGRIDMANISTFKEDTLINIDAIVGSSDWELEHYYV
ncbi:hypothetical protein ACJX0J_040869, partial [Zea mays]